MHNIICNVLLYVQHVYVCICVPLLFVLVIMDTTLNLLNPCRYEFDFKDNEMENQFELDLACPRLAINVMHT